MFLFKINKPSFNVSNSADVRFFGGLTCWTVELPFLKVENIPSQELTVLNVGYYQNSTIGVTIFSTPSIRNKYTSISLAIIVMKQRVGRSI